MKKVLLSLLSLGLCTSLLGCGATQSTSPNNQNDSTPKQITVNSNSTSGGSTDSNLDKEAFKNGYTAFSLKDSAIYTSLFQINGSSLFFPNWDDNNNLSVLKEPYPNNVINTSNVSDFFNYPVSSLVIINNVAYFSDGNNNSTLSSIDTTSRAYKPNLASGKVTNMITVNNIIYFVDQNDGNKLHAFDTTNNSDKIISFDNVGNYLVDEDTILYENKSDKSTLYKINADGTQKQKLSNFSVNSFAPYSGQILAINSSDDNNLYSINLTDLSTKRLAIMNGEDMKIFNGTIYFINVTNNRHLSKMTVDLTQSTPSVNFSDISDYEVNEYYPTSKGIFARKGVNVNNGYIFLPA
ncbi:DUF5050 domain-containing protein [Clostridium saccharobutylicum]|uniref:DUF5050 domain-containing protein n=1 Tax=Clostridium saccharobutylicum TaxID=169679 RepID=UPI00111DC9CA|nr:DUF5050 domain-containing protein [Clostridium saccharobutylicum]MBA2907422.1 hypothetical protein [Clostridium saccharobutylicum]MBA8791960.1 hypothetical protein [Clostridium saccharobutylicum]MBA8898700.1 hypothetical protein [Clostridium saccharobutylicum]MBA8983654.1 hypothetical protein [Clostridium saccharobutylicum]MBA8996187.1 hypothetical protein [Clostridium saccharobutylicum]